METRFVLVAGNNAGWLEDLRLELGTGWEFISAANGEAAIERFHQFDFEMVLLGRDLNDTEIRMLKKIFPFQQPGIRFLEEDNKTVSQLAEELKSEEARLTRERKSYQFLDNAFGFPICLQ